MVNQRILTENQEIQYAEIIQRYPILWQKGLTVHLRKTEVANAWIAIQKEVEAIGITMSVELLKTAWTKIRDKRSKERNLLELQKRSGAASQGGVGQNGVGTRLNEPSKLYLALGFLEGNLRAPKKGTASNLVVEEILNAELDPNDSEADETDQEIKNVVQQAEIIATVENENNGTDENAGEGESSNEGKAESVVTGVAVLEKKVKDNGSAKKLFDNFPQGGVIDMKTSSCSTPASSSRTAEIRETRDLQSSFFSQLGDALNGVTKAFVERKTQKRDATALDDAHFEFGMMVAKELGKLPEEESRKKKGKITGILFDYDPE